LGMGARGQGRLTESSTGSLNGIIMYNIPTKFLADHWALGNMSGI